MRQGDPLSPLLLVLVADHLQTILNFSMQRGQITKPIQTAACPHFPIVQYADDTLIIMQADLEQLLLLQHILLQFHTSTGLKVNFQKSTLIPINIQPNRAEMLATIFGCQIGTLPFTYLGLPTGNSKPKIEEFLPLIQRIEKRLTSSPLCFHMEADFNWLTLSSHHYPILYEHISSVGCCYCPD